MTHYQEDMHQWLHLHLQSTHNEQSLPLNAVACIFLFKDKKKSFPISFTMPTLPARLPATLQHAFFKMENSLFTPHLDDLFNLWNNTVCQMNYWVCAAGRYSSTSMLERFHKAFFDYYQFDAMTYMPDEIILARMMTTLDLEFKRALHYQDEGFDSNNDCELPPWITRPIYMYFIFTIEASFNLADLTKAKQRISPFTSRHPRSQEGVCRHLTFNEIIPPMPKTDHEDDKEPPNCRPGWSGAGWGAGTRQQEVSLYPWNS